MKEDLLILGVGNEDRGDDGAGIVAARRLRALGLPGATIRETSGEIGKLCEMISNAKRAILVDAAVSGGQPGALHRFEAHRQALPAAFFNASSHQLGLAEAIELCRALGSLPERLIVYGVEGAQFEIGAGLSPPVEEALPALLEQVHREGLCLTS